MRCTKFGDANRVRLRFVLSREHYGTAGFAMRNVGELVSKSNWGVLPTCYSVRGAVASNNALGSGLLCPALIQQPLETAVG